MGFYESSEEILACPHNRDVALVGCFNRFIAGFSCGAIYLHIILKKVSHLIGGVNLLLLTLSLLVDTGVVEVQLR